MTGDGSGSTGDGEGGDHTEGSAENIGSQFDRLPATADERAVPERATRQELLAFWEQRYGIDPAVFADHSFWERGAGKVWAFRSEAPSPVEIQGLGMTVLRTRQEHWKPTLEAVQRFGRHATRNRIRLSRRAAARFLAGEDQEVGWDGDWGYLVVTHELAGESEPLGVGLYVHGELRSMVPKGRRREL
jgi:NOL1/NOP2/fmu family ribosome biogenesis protein